MADWLFDLGNSRLKAAPILGARHGDVVANAHGGDPARFDAVLPDAGEVAYLASVAGPALSTALLDALARRFQRICVARTQRSFAGVRIAYAEPARLGVDRFLALLGGHDGGGPALVVAVGTALTVDLLDAGGRHRGGRIAPAPTLMREALHGRVPHLPEEGGAYAEFASSTLDALASGCDGAALGLVERSLAQAAVLLGESPRLLLHGGGAGTLRGRIACEWRPGLVMDGLLRWARAGGAGTVDPSAGPR
jgi:type III pantothenate kinase